MVRLSAHIIADKKRRLRVTTRRLGDLHCSDGTRFGSWEPIILVERAVPIVNSKSERTDGGDRLRSAPKARGQPSWVFGRDGGRQQRAEATVAPAGRAIRSCRDDRDYRCRPSWRSREALAG